MKTLNRVFLVGSVGRDPEIKSTASGVYVANLSLATSERFKDKSGDWQDATEWHALTAFARTAEVIRDYVVKGSQIHVEGRLQTHSWDDKASGQKRYKTEIVIENLILLGGKRESAPAKTEARQAAYPVPDDDDIPF